jgi:hypothetical protein
MPSWPPLNWSQNDDKPMLTAEQLAAIRARAEALCSNPYTIPALLAHIEDLEAELSQRVDHVVLLAKDRQELSLRVDELERERARLRDALTEIDGDSKRIWKTNAYHGSKEMIGCRFCPASQETSDPAPFVRHRLCALQALTTLPPAPPDGETE